MPSTGELIDIERVTISSEGGRWKSTHRGNSLAAYPTSRPVLRGLEGGNTFRLPSGNLMLGFQGGVSIPLVKGGVRAPPAKRQCRAGPKAGARRGFTGGVGPRDQGGHLH